MCIRVSVHLVILKQSSKSLDQKSTVNYSLTIWFPSSFLLHGNWLIKRAWWEYQIKHQNKKPQPGWPITQQNNPLPNFNKARIHTLNAKEETNWHKKLQELSVKVTMH